MGYVFYKSKMAAKYLHRTILNKSQFRHQMSSKDNTLNYHIGVSRSRNVINTILFYLNAYFYLNSKWLPMQYCTTSNKPILSSLVELLWSLVRTLASHDNARSNSELGCYVSEISSWLPNVRLRNVKQFSFIELERRTWDQELRYGSHARMSVMIQIH